MFADAAFAEAGPGSTAVAAGSSQAAAVAEQILNAGGSAVDAVVAAGFVTPVCEPVLSSIAGGGFCLYSRPDRHCELLDFFVDVPGLGGHRSSPHVETKTVRFADNAEQVFHAGWGTVATPGCLAGYLDAHSRWGRLPLSEVVAPAIRAAREGVALDATQVRFLRVVEPIVTLTPQAKAIYEPALLTGISINPAYADLLSALAKGDLTGAADPAWVDLLVGAVRDGGGILSEQDINKYQPIVRAPLRTEHAGAQIQTNPPPSFGGSIVLDALDLIAQSGDSGWYSVAQALEAATDRGRQITDVSRGTTHISAIDRYGGVASMSVSNGSGSGVVVNGVQLNNMLGEEDLNIAIRAHGIEAIHDLQPGQRMGSMMAPTIATLPDGTEIALGSGGSERIRSAITTTLVNVIDHRRSLVDSITAPRLHVATDRIDVEPGALPNTSDVDGRPVHRWENTDLFFGGVHAVARRADGSVVAVGDPRRGGAVAVGP